MSMDLQSCSNVIGKDGDILEKVAALIGFALSCSGQARFRWILCCHVTPVRVYAQFPFPLLGSDSLKSLQWAFDTEHKSQFLFLFNFFPPQRRESKEMKTCFPSPSAFPVQEHLRCSLTRGHFGLGQCNC